jgi:transcriptional regulator with XRE-family HTH domain
VAPGVDVSRPEFRERLNRLCEQTGLDATELARRSGVSVRVVRDLMAGTRTRASRHTLDALAATLRTPTETLLTGAPGEIVAPAAAPAAPWWKRHRGLVTIGIIGAVALLVCLRVGRHDPDLVFNVTCEGRQIELRDRQSMKTAWRDRLTSPVSIAVIGPWARDNMAVYGTRAGGVESGRLYVRALRRPKQLVQTITMTPRGLYPAEIATNGSFGPVSSCEPSNCQCARMPDVDGDGEREIVVKWGFDPWYPACLALYKRSKDAGIEEMRAYFTCGAIRDVYAGDIDGDGKDEVIFLSTNNARAYEGAMVTVLDDDHWSGAAIDSLSAATHWAGPGVAGDGCLARVIFPQFSPDLMTALGAMRLEPAGLEVSHTPDGELRIRMTINTPPWMVITLDGRLDPIDVELTDVLDRQLPAALSARFHQGYVEKWLATRVHFGVARVDGR